MLNLVSRCKMHAWTHTEKSSGFRLLLFMRAPLWKNYSNLDWNFASRGKL